MPVIKTLLHNIRFKDYKIEIAKNGFFYMKFYQFSIAYITNYHSLVAI
jgi:hypothetical protein